MHTLTSVPCGALHDFKLRQFKVGPALQLLIDSIAQGWPVRCVFFDCGGDEIRARGEDPMLKPPMFLAPRIRSIPRLRTVDKRSVHPS